MAAILFPSELGLRRALSTAKELFLQLLKLPTGEKKYIGGAITIHGKKNATYVEATVNKEFQGVGVGKALFEHAKKLYARAGKKYLRSYNILSPKQIAIRSKHQTKFVASKGGSHGTIVGAKKAIENITSRDRFDNDSWVRASTKLGNKKKIPTKPKRLSGWTEQEKKDNDKMREHAREMLRKLRETKPK